MNNEIKITKQEAEVMLDRPEDCVWDNLGPYGSDSGFSKDEVYDAVYRIHDSIRGWERSISGVVNRKKKMGCIPANITQLEAEVIYSMVDGGLWMNSVIESEDFDSTPQWRSRARKSFRTLCEKLESFDPPGGWDYPPTSWSGGI